MVEQFARHPASCSQLLMEMDANSPLAYTENNKKRTRKCGRHSGTNYFTLLFCDLCYCHIGCAADALLRRFFGKPWNVSNAVQYDTRTIGIFLKRFLS